jgi:hypothetical protein
MNDKRHANQLFGQLIQIDKHHCVTSVVLPSGNLADKRFKQELANFRLPKQFANEPTGKL